MNVATGIYLRIKRKEGWVNVDVAEMTDEEIADFVDNMSAETAKKAWSLSLHPGASVVMQGNGPGKYDELCTHVREHAEADFTLVCILNGNKGSGFSVQSRPNIAVNAVVALLRDMANQIERVQEAANS